MLDIDKIRQLVDMMVTNELMEISIRDGDSEVTLRRPHLNSAPTILAGPGNPGPVTLAPAGPAAAEATSLPAAPEEREVESIEIKSPMVGTFYAAPDPNSPAFVQVGSRVQPATVVCIIEAMKVFNEIKAEMSGVVDRILAKNAQAVEYGQPLFRVRPD